MLALCREQDIRGTLLLATEGINGTIAGNESAVETILGHIRALPGCANLAVRRSNAATPPFHRLKVRLKREIVTMGEPVDPLADAGTYVTPAEWNALIADPDTIVIDTRNDYEVRIGSFAGAIDPGTRSFSEFPAWFREQRERLLDGKAAPKVAMFCTGGIRCEKATAFLKAEGVADVFHLQGGILNYLETVPAADSRWQGECFVFDERVAVGNGAHAGHPRIMPRLPHAGLARRPHVTALRGGRCLPRLPRHPRRAATRRLCGAAPPGRTRRRARDPARRGQAIA